MTYPSRQEDNRKLIKDYKYFYNKQVDKIYKIHKSNDVGLSVAADQKIEEISYEEFMALSKNTEEAKQ